ncbi:hypothetical protein NEMIN01_0278 [Nematocida minor]|uniref:uncharacterized protein n=1 Tax=Nematocida minor TaxID=1912983 RepID=UPI00221F815C|nr:uncharacterized protein NEMIN01_0278 [Nematocida minor]KAI5189112.1 hypothetical protein NEMIN01_0278 [Nematocida minor]
MDINEKKTSEAVHASSEELGNRNATEEEEQPNQEYTSIFFNRFGKIASRPPYIQFSISTAHIKKELEELEKDKNVDEHMLFGTLHSLVSKHTEVTVDSSVDELQASLLSDIATLVLEEAVIAYTYDKNKHLYQGFSYSARKEKIVHALREAVNVMEQKCFSKKVEKRINAWYEYIIGLNKLDTVSYLIHTRDFFNERACWVTVIYKPLKDHLRKFVNFLEDRHRITREKNLFKKHDNGTYNIDYAINLLLKYRKYIQNYPTDPELQKKDEMPENDKNLLAALDKLWHLVAEIYNNVHILTDVEKKYVDRAYLVDYFNNGPEKGKDAIADPMKYEYKEIPTRKDVANTLKTKPYRNSTKEYILNKIESFRDLVKTGSGKKTIVDRINITTIVGGLFICAIASTSVLASQIV